MVDRYSRTWVGLTALAGLWIAVYWWWEPRGSHVTFDDGAPVRQVTLSPIAEPAVKTVPTPQPMVLPHSSSPALAPPPSGPPPVEIAVVPPAFREYTIRAGDTLRSIARRELGSERYADEIARANPLKNTQALRPGRTLRLPVDPGNIQGRPVDPAAAVPTPPPAEARAIEYVVKPGDSLTRIAREQYGSTTFIELIMRANQLQDADSLRAGQVLRLPPKPAQ